MLSRRRVHVSVVEGSAAFYKDALGFAFRGFYDYERRAYMPVRNDDEPAVYAGLTAGKQKFGLQRPMNEKQARAVTGRRGFAREAS